ncbi:acetylornithine transaminase [Gallaecimonas mangrovi]|uniref:acetylornithine transaminase n=1 Tax=Gallaecimonas mangrovi TaxID=2291597 RepID=UPI000E2036E1|nr:acetylornithine transaminase [Gallaecimonas mangrovi]
MHRDFAALIPVAKKPKQLFVKGQGSYLFDSQGQSYLDLIQGWAVNTLGHCPAVMQQALAEQAATLVNASPGFYNEPLLKLANTLVAHSVFDQVFFASSGAEANEGAIKLARRWGEKHKKGAFKIITFEGGFHGRTLATMSACGKPAFEKLFEPKVPGFIKVPFNDLAAVKAAIDDATVAVMLEPIQGEAGVIPATAAFLRGLQQLCEANNLLLIVDEVQTGIGRTGKLFAYQHHGIKPHIMTLAKGLGGGVPLSAMLIDKTISCFEYGDQGGTFSGNPLMCAVGLAMLNAVTAPGFLDEVNERSRQLWAGLEALSQKYGLGEVRGQGLLLALNTGEVNANVLVEKAMAAGLLINAPRPNTLRFMPALNISEAQIAEALAILDGLFHQ